MATEEYVSALKQFGADIIAGSRPISNDISVVDFDSKDLLEFFNFMRSQTDQELKAGFSYFLSNQLEKNFSKYDESSLSQIKSSLLSYAQTIKNEKELIGILAAFDSMFTLCGGDWPELVSFIFSNSNPSTNDLLRCQILDSLKFIRDEKFINAHSKQLITLIQRFLNLDLPNTTKAMFLSILALCLQGKIKIAALDEDNDENISEDNIEEKVPIADKLFDSVWKVAIEIASTTNYRSVYPALQQFCQNVKDFKNHTSISVNSIVETFSDSDSDLESRLTAIKPILRLLPFLNDQLILESIIPSSLECLTIDYFSSMAIIDHIGETDIELFDNDFIISLWELLSSEINKNTNHQRNAAIALFAPFADQIINTVEDSLENITQAIITSLNEINTPSWTQDESQFSALVAVISLRSIIPRFESPSPELFHSLIPHITTTNNETLLIEANKTMRELLETGVFSEDDYEKELIDLFPKFKETRIGFFTKLIISLFSGKEDPGLSLAEPIFDFALPLLSQEKATLGENALALEIFALLADISTDFVEDQVQDCIDVAINILNSTESQYFPSAALFLSVISISFHDIANKAIDSILPRLLEIVRGKTGDGNMIQIEPKQISKVALSTCEIVKEYNLRDVSSELSQMAIDMINSEERFDKILICGSQMLEIISKFLLPEDAQIVFEKVTDYLSKSSDIEIDEEEKELNNEVAENLIHALKKILKKYKVIDFEDADVIMKRLFGEQGGIFGLPNSIEAIEDPDTNVFTFMKAFILKFKRNNKTIYYIKNLIALAYIIDSEVLPSLLDPIEAAIDNKIFKNNDDVKDFLDRIIDMIDVDDSDITTSLLTAITSIVRSYIQVVNIPAMISVLNRIWENVDETEEDIELPMAIAMLALELYSNTDDGNTEEDDELNEQLLIDLLEILPLPPDVCDLEHVIQSVLIIVDKNWAKSNEDVMLNLSILMTKICLMKKNEIAQYDLSSNVVPDLRKKLKEIVKSNEDIESKIKINFSKNGSALSDLLK